MSAAFAKKAATGVKTTLAADAVVGATRVSVASMAGFLVGHKLRVGGKANAEERMITGFGSLCFLDPLLHAHVAGEPVLLLKPSPHEAKRFEAWALRDFLLASVLAPVVARAAAEGQRVVDARKGQAAFAARPVEKHVFCVEPTSVKRLAGSCAPVGKLATPRASRSPTLRTFARQ
jgi:hypothetical protein